MRRRRWKVGLEEALRVAGEAGIYAYDAYVICCGEKCRALLISLDDELMRVAEGMGVEVVRPEV